MKKLTILVAVLAVAAGALAADVDLRERAVTDAKAAYVADPSAENLAALERAAAAFQGGLKSIEAMVTETEPNDTPGTANTVADGDYMVADISPAGDVDYFSNGGNAIQDLVYAAVNTAGGSAGTDSQLNVYANDGTTLIEFDDDGGPGLASCVAGGVAPQAGNVFFAVNEFGNNGEIIPYEMHQVVAPASAAISEVEPNDDAATATPITAVFVDGALSAVAADVDFFSFPADAGDIMEVIVDEDPDVNGTSPDTELDLLDTDGSTVLAAGDDNSSLNNNCAGSAVAPSTGTYYVRIGDGGLGNDLTYRFTVVVNGGPIPVELMSFDVE